MPVNPLDWLDGTIWALEGTLWADWLGAIVLGNIDVEFSDRILANRSYWCLVFAGIPGDILHEICARFHAFMRLRESAIAGLKQRGGVRQKGRPREPYGVFQLVCSMLAKRYGHGMRLSEEFADLGYLVFGKRIAPDSYHTLLKRAWQESGLRPSSCEEVPLQSRPTTHQKLLSAQMAQILARPYAAALRSALLGSNFSVPRLKRVLLSRVS